MTAADAYDDRYFADQHVEKDEGELDWFVRHAAAAPAGLALDVGCGTGRFARALAAAGRPAVGVDISEWAMQAGDVRGAVAAADGGLPFAAGSVTLLTALDVVEHLRSPVTFLEEARRVLAPGGWLVLSTPNAGSVLRRVQRDRWYGLSDPTHLHLFDAFSLATLVSRSGLVVSDVVRRSGAGHPLVRQLLDRTLQGGQLVVTARPG